jgi:hypothetical protein
MDPHATRTDRPIRVTTSFLDFSPVGRTPAANALLQPSALVRLHPTPSYSPE